MYINHTPLTSSKHVMNTKFIQSFSSLTMTNVRSIMCRCKYIYMPASRYYLMPISYVITNNTRIYGYFKGFRLLTLWTLHEKHWFNIYQWVTEERHCLPSEHGPCNLLGKMPLQNVVCCWHSLLFSKGNYSAILWLP